jgi:recombination protein U|tara:strand:+ start:174 stop:689 length:516 start_codon:yes stop_codon:yes gene_type:complete
MAKKRKDTGKNFENEIRRSLQSSRHIWWFRIQDTNDINRFVKIAVAEKQPADFFSVYRGRPIMVEAKTSRNLSSFPLWYGNTPAIAKHQIKEGAKLERAGGLSFILIRREEYRNKKCYAITPSQAKYLYSKAFDKKSVKWSWFDKHAYIVDRLKAPLRWNLQKLYEENIND